MAILWNGSLVPWIDGNGDPYSGAKVYFFDDGTTTPLTTYTDDDLSIPNDHPVVANSGGMFPPIFLPAQTVYRLRITDAGDVTIWDVDGISSPTTTIPDPPTSNTENQYLYQTGDIKMAWRTSSPTGYVRLNGRTIGAAASGATERANADCQDLFIHLWEQDANLVVFGGRGATSAGDWAAAKTIALPDFRCMVPVGMAGMGNTASTTIPTDLITGADGDVLGAKAGAAEITLTADQIAAHTHTGTTDSAGAHTHNIPARNSDGSGPDNHSWLQGGTNSATFTFTEMASAGAHTHTFTTASTGGGGSHGNVQPSLFVPYFIKL